MDIELPNGAIIQGIPDGTNKNDIMRKAISAGLAKKSDFAGEVPDYYKQTAQDDSILDNTLAGIGGGMMSLYHGTKQALGADNQAEIDEHRKAMEGLRSTGGGFVGDIAGQAVPMAATLAIPGANTYTGAALLGGLTGTAQPTLEGESRLANAAIGATGGIAGKFGGDKLGRMLAGNPEAGLNASKQAALNVGTKLGFKQTPGHASGSKGLQRLEAQLESNPFTSRSFDSIKDHNQTTLNRIAAKTMGESSDTLDAQVLGTIKSKAGTVYDKVANNTPRAIDQDDVINKLVVIADEYENMLPGDLLDQKLVGEFFKLTEKGQATGRQLQHLSSRLGRTAKNNMTTASGDREVGKALFDFKEVVDDHLAQGLSDDLAAEFTKARGNYRTLMQMTSRNNIVNPSDGNVHPVALANYLQKNDKNGFLFGKNQSDLYNAARFGQAFKPIVGDSGTATRSGQNMDIATMIGSPFTNIAAKLYTSKPSTSMVGGIEKSGLLHLPQEALPYLQQMGLLGGAMAGSQSQGR